MNKKSSSGRRVGTPWIEEDGIVAYEVHNPNRKTFGLSLSNEQFAGWAEDGRKVKGYAEFPKKHAPIPFACGITSGKELTFNSANLIDALKDCRPGDKIRFHFHDGLPLLNRKEGSGGKAGRSEGAEYLKLHRRYERNQKLARRVREHAQGVCEVCGVDYAKKYGCIGKNVIEAHHLLPLSQGVRQSDEDDLIAICANCHRLAHAWMRDREVGQIGLKELKNRFGAVRQ
ncbi:HNH endonuclease [Salipiger mucosus]|uniref:HNH endonuclease n=1 Tax=Salipiger mucosus TaxID=263378 RepID=UPI001C304F8B|nr:HNH endonuclease [Salipiger mucosus]